ncbi:hypothetical protein [Streptomyces sp. H27-D2]|uniref:hypothetical protein n=1 Tax=Streptomyces sp. H27-D2 TaxID=3046304 RepID=UPI002DBF1C6D|nr:hypothetical protein [Streptomyces sp. H27-D2]MEC4015290.1 hypothetical protein [Streptomyces sp. H27-D2]
MHVPAHQSAHVPGRARPGARTRPHLSVVRAMPVLLGMVFGAYAVFLDRSGSTSRAVTLGLVSAAAAALLCYLVARLQPAMIAEVRAASYATLLGGGIGFLDSLTGVSVLRASSMGLVFAGAMFIASYYVFHSRSD